MKKQEILDSLADLPDEIEMKEFEKHIAKLIFLEKIKQGDKALAEGRVMTLDEVKKRFEQKWQNL